MEVENILRSALAIVGPGRTGKAFARSWISAGGHVQEVLGRDLASAARFAREIGQGRPESIGEASFDCDLLVLAVPDDAIESAAGQLAGRVSCRVVFHFSGARPADLLSPFRKYGAAAGSLHPLKAFHGGGAESWQGTFVAVEGDPLAVEAGLRAVRALGARGREIAPEDKPLYHAGATLAAGGCLALVSLAVRIWTSLGLPENEARTALAGLGSQALAALEQQGFEEAFTGPIARRDVGTVRDHGAALAAFPEILLVYGLLARETLDRTPGRGQDEQIRALLATGKPKA
jgi:predicted short-subunit dehydrogenase-like oxidoreductase (DUF2520 family)